jgi:hypothetical protein
MVDDTSLYRDMTAYYGDLHSHCNIGYAHGSIEEAFQNARLQLDFACVTVHAHWHDIPKDEDRLAYLVKYHEDGFKRTAEQWNHLKQVVAEQHEDNKFVTFLGFEWHSNTYGDHNIYFNGADGEIIRAMDMPELKSALRDYADQGIETMLIPHHIGYKAGYRGISWDKYDPEFISVVEIMSMHGASESSVAPKHYLHTMGPLDGRSTLQYGLEQGAIVGVVGSTDHHSAHPGSYGHGKLGVWATDLSRNAIWAAIKQRRTYALTGDSIELEFTLNDTIMGSIAPPSDTRDVNITVCGGDAIDYIDIVHNNNLVHRYSPLFTEIDDPYSKPLKVYFEVGWGERGIDTYWDVDLKVVDGELLRVEPRFRGHDIVAPQDDEQMANAFSQWQRNDENAVHFQTRTWGNPTTSTASTQGMSFEIKATPNTRFSGEVNGIPIDVAIKDLLQRPHAEYLGGFVSPAFYFHQAILESDYHINTSFSHVVNSAARDWYYVRVRQKNGHWAWSSPIWIDN